MSAFKIGDLVELKSGGPELVVTGLDNAAVHPRVYCEWFDGKELRGAYFLEPALRLTTPPEPATA